jgi:YHS domain-containing protein
MWRFLFQFIALLLLFSVARTVIVWVLRLFAVTLRPGSQAKQEVPPAQAPDGVLRSAGELFKDPVCGTYVSAATSVQRLVHGQPVYFCSVACRDKYLVPAG